MAIYQGSNDPIVLTFDEDMREVSSISIGLYAKDDSHADKQWTKDMLEFDEDGTIVKAPLTQAETAQLDPGDHRLTVKVMGATGNVILYGDSIVPVKMRYDREVIL